MKNILLYTLPAWGHTKPLVALMVLIAERRPDVLMTVPVCILYPKIMAELGRIPKERLEKIQERIRIVQVPNPDFPATIINHPEMIDTLKMLFRGEEVKCAVTGKVVRMSSKPDVVIMDFIAGNAYDAIRSLDPERSVPIIAWNTSMNGPVMNMFGPEELGGRGNVSGQFKALTDKGMDPLEACKQIFMSVKGDVVQIPGYPPLYDYEIYPQDVDMSLHLRLLPVGSKVMNDADGIIATSARFLEGETIDSLDKFYKEKGLWSMSSLALISSMTMVSEKEVISKDKSGAIEFLDRVSKDVGDHSLIYISFGSHFWPPQVEKLVVILEELISSRTPFLLGRGSPLATLPDEILKKVEGYDLGMVMQWTPQDDILRHPATGWFLSHGGWNSTQESIRYKVPQIFWPLSADQPIIAALMSVKRRTGFELYSVRSGLGAKTPYHLREQTKEVQFTLDAVRSEFKELLTKIRGEEGAFARQAIERMSDEADKLWSKGGEAETGLQTFFDRFL